MVRLTNFIGGRATPPSAGGWLDIIEPATGEVWAQAPDSTQGDIDSAVDAARDAFPGWASSTAKERSGVLARLADRLEGRLEEFARAESKDTGKPLTLATALDIPRAVENLRFFAGLILHTHSEFYPTNEAEFNYTLRQPRGVAGLISPWNLPLYLLTWKIAPAIAAGNTCVCKPSEVTPVSAWMLGELCSEAGVPPGAINIVHGRGDTAGRAIVEHPGVPTISFTGSTGVGRWIAERAGKDLKRVSLELGGKNPFVVFADADLELAAQTAVRALFLNQGQICLCASRLLVHESIADAFTDRLVDLSRGLIVGDPEDPATGHGAQSSAGHLEKIESYLAKARELGAEILTGGSRVDPSDLPARCRGGYFFQPTLLGGLPNECAVIQEEIFGPVATIQRFGDDDEAIALANSTPYGLAASIWTRDLARAHLAGARIHAGVVWVNCWMSRDLRTPFGGAKQSGVGREGGESAIAFFTEPKNICVRL